MARYKLSKKDETWLRVEARKLPPDFSTTGSRVAISGKEAALSGLKRTSDTGQAINHAATYLTKVPNITPVNHKRRLIKAYEQGGWPQVNIYLDKYRVAEEKLLPQKEKAQEAEIKPSFMQRIRNKFLN
jgi:hypothetical protein